MRFVSHWPLGVPLLFLAYLPGKPLRTVSPLWARITRPIYLARRWRHYRGWWD